VIDASTLVCLDPTNRPQPAATRGAAPRPSSFEGASFGLVSNTLGRSAELLRAVFDALCAGVAGASAFDVVKPHKSVPPSPDQWARLTSGATMAITGFGG
jgi:hypothetical protein